MPATGDALLISNESYYKVSPLVTPADFYEPLTVFHDLARRRECRIEEGHLMPDHVHMLVSIPPKYSVAEVIGFIKGKSSIWIAQNIERKAKNFTGHKFWARGYFVSTVGRDEETIRAYIRNQELQDRQMDQLALIP